MKSLLIYVFIAASAPGFAQTTVPATPTLHANAEFKGLQFDWAPAARASWYQLEYRAHQTGDFVQLGDDYPSSANSTHFSFPLHLYDWTYARYRLAACNTAGCSRSAEVSVSSLRLDAVGYFKPAQPSIAQEFGADVDLSPNGYNFVSLAPGESTGQSDPTHPAGAIYVFRRGSNGAWFQRARLTPTVAPFNGDFANYMKGSISGNGDTVAVGISNYLHEEMDPNQGEVQVFHWNGTSWLRTSVPRVPGATPFGNSVALSESGSILAVGVGSTVADAGIAIYRLVSGAWQNVRNISRTPGSSESCQYRGALSRDGTTLAQICGLPSTISSPESHFVRVWSGNNWSAHTDIPLESSTSCRAGCITAGLGINANGDTIAAQIADALPTGVSQVNVYQRTNGAYGKVAEFTPGAWQHGANASFYGRDITVSGDGATIGVGDISDIGKGYGPRAAPLFAGSAITGAVYIYRLSGSWKLANVVKPDKSNGQTPFGNRPALSNSGKTLIVGQGDEGGGDGGIRGDWRNTDAPYSGAVWMY
jgi:hypothetical protein